MLDWDDVKGLFETGPEEKDMKLVGDVRCEDEDQSKRLEFLSELEDMMMRYRISTVNVGWAFGTSFSMVEESPDQLDMDFDVEPVVPRTIPISGGPEITPKSGGFRKAGESETHDLGHSPSTLDVLETVVGKMDQEEAEERAYIEAHEGETPPEG